MKATSFVRGNMVRRMLAVFVLFSSVTARGQGIVEYFQRLPRAPFLEGTTTQLLDIMKRAEGKSFIDSKNGYMYLEGDGAQVSLQIALFRYADKTPLLAVAYGELEEPEFTNLAFFTELKGEMVPMERAVFPVADAPSRRFTLPHKGRVVIVSKADGKELSRWLWTGEIFEKQ